MHRNYASWKCLISGGFNPDAKLVNFASGGAERPRKRPLLKEEGGATLPSMRTTKFRYRRVTLTLGIAVLACSQRALSSNVTTTPRDLSSYTYCPVKFKSRSITKDLAVTAPDPERFNKSEVYEIDTLANVLTAVQTFDRGSGYILLKDGRMVHLKQIRDISTNDVTIADMKITCEPIVNPSSDQKLTTTTGQPVIPGFRLVSSSQVITANQRIGLWQSMKGPKQTKVILYKAEGSDNYKKNSQETLATLDFSGDQIFIEPGLDSPIWGISILSQERARSPAIIANFIWFRRPPR